LAEDLEELVAVLSRNYGVNTVISHQNLSQLEPRIQNVLLQMGTQVIGRVVNPEDALLLAKSLLAFDPQRVKKWETQWMALPEGTAWFLEPQGKHFNGQPYQPLSERTIPFAVDVKTTEYTADEQYILLADQIKALPRFAFFVKTATTEGTISKQVRRLSIEHFDAGQYPHEPTIAYVRSCLRHTCGVPVEQLLAEIAQRRPPAQSEPAQAKPKANAPKPKPLPKDGTIPGDAAHVTANHALSDTRARPDPSEGSVWQTIEAPARE
jgi:hypothetical protein